MANPFEKRATEYIRDDEAFLAIVTPEPLTTFFHKPAEEGRLYDRLTTVIGTPGSGKTTLSRIFQYQTLRTLLRNSDQTNYKPFIDSLNRCGALSKTRPTILGCRLPLEAEYRDFWEFPYPSELKAGLMIALLQARTVLSWLRNLKEGGHDLNDVEIVPRRDSEAATAAIGGIGCISVLEKARQIELSIYSISAALIPPDIINLNQEATSAYRPFDVIKAFRITEGKSTFNLTPLVIFDDAHLLHSKQLDSLGRWLLRRELRVARWLLMRLDALSPENVLNVGNIEFGGEHAPGVKMSREVTFIRMQNTHNRKNKKQRIAFRKMARDMANRYLSQMETFNARQLRNFRDMLTDEPVNISQGKFKKLEKEVDSNQTKLGITSDRRKQLEGMIDRYAQGAISDHIGEDLRLSMLNILMERYLKRTPQKSLFDDPEPAKPLKVDSSITDGARIHLLHKYQKPYYYGIDTICDASSENAEIFLQLSSRLVSHSETQLIREKSFAIGSAYQHKLLREAANSMLSKWNFPLHRHVRILADKIAQKCISKSLEPNAPLGGGAIAIGILQDEFSRIHLKFPNLANVLQYGVAYNAFTLVPNHSTKNQIWCLIELGGVLLLHYGLTLKRGGFVESNSTEVNNMLEKV